MILKNNHFKLLYKPIVSGVGDYTTQPTVYNAWWFGATGPASLTATMAVTLDSVSTAISATSGHTATAAFTLADISVAANATLGHSGSIDITLDSISVDIAATVSSGASLTATMAVTLDSLSVSSSAVLGHTATLAATLGDVVFASNATLGHTATLTATLGDIGFASSATLGHSASMAVTLDSISTNINATVTSAGSITGTMAVTLDSIGFAATATVQSQIIVVDTHDGDAPKRKKFQKEVEDKAKRKEQITELYEELVELKPKAAHDAVAPFVADVVQSKGRSVDFYSMLQSLDRTEALYNSLQRELQEIDDEDVLLLL